MRRAEPTSEKKRQIFFHEGGHMLFLQWEARDWG